MRESLNSILQFRDAVDTLYNYSLLEAARLDSSRDHERVSVSFLVKVPTILTTDCIGSDHDVRRRATQTHDRGGKSPPYLTSGTGV